MKPLAPLTLRENLLQTLRSVEFSRDSLADYTYVLLGALVQAFAMRLFLIPAQLVSGGISGASQLINFYTGWPIA
uniref:Uncharacterized protein n=1 Tax=Anaerolinea thermolimosa TaxID=229919 RepID=A0A7C4PM61_9CHLR